MTDFQHFVDAQASVYDTVKRELASGRKRTHWMWYIFPQLAGLGESELSRRFALGGLDDARAYLAHPVLGVRLQECADLVLAAPVRSAEELMGFPDHLKLHASMTLFAQVSPPLSVYHRVLTRFWSGRLHEETVALLPRP